jgi:hypothetical protein
MIEQGDRMGFNLDLLGLLIECKDALMVPTYGYQDRQEHQRILSKFINSEKTPDDIKKILIRVSEIFLNIEMDVMAFTTGQDNSIKIILNDLSKILYELQAPTYIYHGTIYGNLKSIKQNGLVPGAKPVWKNREELRDRSDKFVFFSSTWRRAAEWAGTAHAKSRGPRKSQNRLQVVIRIPAQGLKIEPDNLTIAPGNLMVSGRVITENAEVLIGPLKGYPKWQPLD